MSNRLMTKSLLVLLLGCDALRPDSAPPAFESNYPTAEFRTAGELHHGSAEVVLYRGQPYDEVDLAIQGYFEGTIRIDSDRCDLGQSYTYTDSELFRVEIKGLAEESCLIDFSIQPKLPDEETSGQVIHEFKGRLLIKVLEMDQPWWGLSSKIKVGLNKRIRIPFVGEGKAKVAFRGCGSEFQKELPIKENMIKVSAEDVVGKIIQRTCFLEGVIIQEETIKRISWTIWGYAQDFPPLPVPVIKKISFGRTEFITDEAVAIISLDRSHKTINRGKFRFNPRNPHIFRALTAKGRSLVCEWSVENKVWSCLN